ncbi:MAG: hypothetical protein Faunusvirus2_52 [Faunusvirus sp.]|jgi:hypothetical protein|uniref:Uncharacterized protein n=1 Tax=Faunusvirus sp. TaxID=2487766 RepID=A0A3G4ZW44_9VIRU|nr:MAG: hypothetical protein Faunusvirus2_52 [Faunusvirus sp.]
MSANGQSESKPKDFHKEKLLGLIQLHWDQLQWIFVKKILSASISLHWNQPSIQYLYNEFDDRSPDYYYRHFSTPYHNELTDFECGDFIFNHKGEAWLTPPVQFCIKAKLKRLMLLHQPVAKPCINAPQVEKKMSIIEEMD